MGQFSIHRIRPCKIKAKRGFQSPRSSRLIWISCIRARRWMSRRALYGTLREKPAKIFAIPCIPDLTAKLRYARNGKMQRRIPLLARLLHLHWKKRADRCLIYSGLKRYGVCPLAQRDGISCKSRGLPSGRGWDKMSQFMLRPLVSRTQIPYNIWVLFLI